MQLLISLHDFHVFQAQGEQTRIRRVGLGGYTGLQPYLPHSQVKSLLDATLYTQAQYL